MSSSCKTHQHCINTALKHAESICAEKGVRFTSIRKRVLELVWAEHEPMKAYDLLAKLQKEDSSAKPPTVYRALDFLLEHGLIHKIHRLNAYVGCGDPYERRRCFFLICTKCHTLQEGHEEGYQLLMEHVSKAYDFKVTDTIFELEGVCSNCKDKPLQ